jgi:hypothetical protein
LLLRRKLGKRRGTSAEGKRRRERTERLAREAEEKWLS